MGRATGTTSDPVGGCGPIRPTRASTKVAAGSQIAERFSERIAAGDHRSPAG